jgi:hypothetical protein
MPPLDPREHREQGWEAQEPPSDFADRVMDRFAREESGDAKHASVAPPRRMRLTRVFGGAGLALAASVALVFAWHGGFAPSRGEAIAADRREVQMGDRAALVLEPGARVSWTGDEVTQPAGDVFYRVERGGAFRVHTPAGDVQVLGTCFRVRVEGTEDDVNGRDVKAGAIGAALSAAALVSVYEGKVAVSRANAHVTLTAGESARADSTGIHVHEHAGEGAEGAEGAEGKSDGASGEDLLAAANANLADSVREYKQRLEAIEAQKKGVEKQLADAQQKLATAENDGQAPITKNDYDLNQDDWKQLAAKGEVRSQTPCTSPDSWDYKPDQLTKMGLAPQDAQPIHDALQHSIDRTWATVKPMCAQALKGNADLADVLGVDTCETLIFHSAKANKEDPDEAIRQVAEIRAGILPMSKLDSLGTLGKMLYATSGESKAIEADLGRAIGPDDARRFVYADEGCWHHSSHGVGPRPTLPK